MTHSETKNVMPLFYIDDRDAINGHLYMVGHSIPDMGIINFFGEKKIILYIGFGECFISF